MIASVGAFWFGASQLLFLYAMVQCARGKGEQAPAKPWDGADTLEWTLPSPIPYHTFETPPVVK
jgi:cytochrome c oxidase subunit 1